MKPKFEPIEDGLEIIDPIERHRYRLTTHEPVTPTPVDRDRIQYPIDAAVEITTEMLTLPAKNTVYVRDEEGEMITEVKPNEQQHFVRGAYTLDLSLSLKFYVNVDSSISIYSDHKHTYITFNEPTQTIIGARSYHTRPAETIKTTSDPVDVIEAVSAFGSALKTTTSERSYPTLRGHPPALTLGDELDIPDLIDRPESGVKIEIPPTLDRISVITPLAYYLGARVVPGSKSQLTTETGYTYSFEKGEKGFESTVERVLKQIFFLDCVTRTEGIAPLPLYKRQIVEPILELDLETVYNQPLSKQLETYLEIPFSRLEPHLPDWQFKTRFSPTDDVIEFLPFIANDLAIVSIEGSNDDSELVTEPQSQTQAIEEFTRAAYPRGEDTTHRSSVSSQPTRQSSIRTIQQSWNGTNSSSINSTTSLSAFHNSIDRTPREDPIAIDVICNDSEMHKEIKTVNDVYGNHDELPFDVTIHYDLTKQSLRKVLEKETDFCHYIGHIDQNGVQCPDGRLDLSSIDHAGVKAFLLNACQSYNQGLYLVEAGSIGGIVTLGDVVNSGAISVGCVIARLLNRGFPLYAALDIARKESIIGEQYHIVGDGFTTIAQSETRNPTVCEINKTGSDILVELLMYIGTENGKGSLFRPYLEPADSYYLLPGKSDPISVTESQLREFFEQENTPILINDTIYWNEDFLCEL